MTCLRLPKTFELMIKKIIEDKTLLNNKPFMELFETALLDWANNALAINAGNNRSYNLNRSGATINRIAGVRETLMMKRYDVDWEWLLSDVEHISKICRFELRWNYFRAVPHHPLENDRYYIEYRDMSKEDFERSYGE
jgi:hypothetical protein